ncbi:suppressor of rasval19 [Coemansia sp. RSA 1813]|nr:suppressor of rasval19 [Coemansia sp. RSA 1646]KAJ1773596.1 suppressor of rasval19 [Coemansia sp. RSA 1843]KAJ2092388.1 suppressor of rasval19 [Coemansia sp. RSA 986]KAJ2217387.1 suppressor of rasval19 [Coemansia sp. RSA 487]KAJ2572612.1 suppressor of rasval19 [Coemansia sp. RSA 1813]
MTNSIDLQHLLKRIEKATARLEEVANRKTEQKAQPASSSVGSSADAGSLAGDAGADSKTVTEYVAMVKPLVQKYVECSSKIGGVVSEQAHELEALFDAQIEFIRIAGLTKKPSSEQLPELISVQQEAIQKVIALKDNNRPSELFDNLSTVAEGVSAFGWVVVEPTPVPYINEMKDSAQFYSNRVLKKWRETDENQVEWVKAFLGIFRELAAYVKEFHTTGLTWNMRGEDVSTAVAALKGKKAATSATGNISAQVPPPPPPPAPTAAELSEAKVSNAAQPAADPPTSRSALFAQINKGNTVTSGLRHVDKTEMTHKNPCLRGTGTIKSSSQGDSSGSQDAQAKKATVAQKRPARMELQGTKWVVENYGTEHLTIEATETRQTVYMYNCKGTTLEVKNKLNSIAIDGCQKCGVVFDALVAQCEIVNCKSVQVQSRETVPSIQIDRTDGAHVFLSEAARDSTIITTAKASEVNVSYPFETQSIEDDNFVEQPIPEQLQTVVKDGKLVTTVLEHAG